MQPELAVIIPCYNQGAFVEDAIASVQCQTRSDWELIVVDDGSTDSSAIVISRMEARDPRIRLIRQPNQGVSRARNRGYREVSASVRYVLFLDADDQLHPEMLSTLAHYLDEHPQAGAVFCAFIPVDVHGVPIGANRLFYRPALIPTWWGYKKLREKTGTVPFISTLANAVNLPSNTLLRRTVFEKVGGWNETLPQLAEDRELFMKLALHSELHALNIPLMYYRKHKGQSSMQQQLAVQRSSAMIQEWLRYYQQQPDSKERQQVLRSWHLYMGRIGVVYTFQGGWHHMRRGHVILWVYEI